MAAGLCYPGRVVAVDANGPYVVVPQLGGSARYGPLPTGVPDLQVNDSVVVTSLGVSRDQLWVVGRMTGRAPTMDEIEGLDARLDAGEAHDVTQDGRLSAVETVNGTQNTRLTGVETVNGTQDTRLTGVETVNGTQNTRLTGVETVNGTQDTRLAAVETAASGNTTAITTLRGDTAGKVTTKGDLLVATAAGVLARKPAPANGLLWVADSTASDGWTAKDILGMPRSPTGAVAPSRYIGAISTAGPPIAPLVGAVGDFLLDSAGDTWVCTVAGTPGTWVSRSALANASAQHGWYGTGSPPHNVEQQITGWTAATGSAAIATNGGASGVLLNRAGRWSVHLWAFSDLAASRYAQLRVNWASGALRANVDLVQSDHAQGGYAGSGYSWVHVTWSGPVTAAQAAAPIKLFVYQSNASGAAVPFNYYVDVDFLGGV